MYLLQGSLALTSRGVLLCQLLAPAVVHEKASVNCWLKATTGQTILFGFTLECLHDVLVGMTCFLDSLEHGRLKPILC